MRLPFLLFLVGIIAPGLSLAQRQYSDTLYSPPAFEARFSGEGVPVVMVDESHHNFHTKNGRYRPFTNVVETDGFKVGGFSGETTKANLDQGDVLVISNALPESSLRRWAAPTASAFTTEEITTIHEWVKDGGRLLLIADHMPMGGAAKDLAAAFGFTFYDAFADNERTNSGVEIFSQRKGTLESCVLTQESEGYFKVDSVATFTGQAFEIPTTATSVLNCGEGWVSRLPEVAWQFNDDTEVLNSEGWSQGAFMPYGKGKIVVFGEAAMFSAQAVEFEEETIQAGMNSKEGDKNYLLLLNIMRWLASD